MAKAYAELTREGWLDSQPGRGVFVASGKRIYSRGEQRRRIEPLIENLIRESIVLGIGPDLLREMILSKCRELGALDAAEYSRL